MPAKRATMRTGVRFMGWENEVVHGSVPPPRVQYRCDQFAPQPDDGSRIPPLPRETVTKMQMVRTPSRSPDDLIIAHLKMGWRPSIRSDAIRYGAPSGLLHDKRGNPTATRFPGDRPRHSNIFNPAGLITLSGSSFSPAKVMLFCTCRTASAGGVWRDRMRSRSMKSITALPAQSATFV